MKTPMNNVKMVEFPKLILRNLKCHHRAAFFIISLVPVSVPSGLRLFHSLETGWPKLPALIEVTCDWHFLIFQYMYSSAYIL